VSEVVMSIEPSVTCSDPEYVGTGYGCGSCLECEAVCDSFAAAMRAAGLVGVGVVGTGGGCRALAGMVPGTDVYLYLTDADADVPTDRTHTYVGAYWEPVEDDVRAGEVPTAQDVCSILTAAQVVRQVAGEALFALTVSGVRP